MKIYEIVPSRNHDGVPQLIVRNVDHLYIVDKRVTYDGSDEGFKVAREECKRWIEKHGTLKRTK